MPARALPVDAVLTTPLAALLALCDGALSDAARAEARSIGADASSAVVTALIHRELQSPTDEFAPVAAMLLATELQLAGAVPALASCFARADLDGDLWEAALGALRAIGAAALDPLLAAFDAHSEPDACGGIAGALLETGAKDDRVLNALLRLLDGDVAVGADKLAQYGDPRALRALLEALDRAEVDPTGDRDFEANENILALGNAIDSLGGALTDSQHTKRRRAIRLRERLYLEARRLSAREIGPAQEPARRQNRPGRNDPCHCGSGKKYKKCHLDADERASTA